MKTLETTIAAINYRQHKNDLSGNKGNGIWIIRFSDGSLRSCHGSLEEAKELAEKLKGSREVEAII